MAPPIPTGAACADGTPLAADNNMTAKMMSATECSPDGTVIALDSGPSGQTGDYRATDLNVAQK